MGRSDRPDRRERHLVDYVTDAASSKTVLVQSEQLIGIRVEPHFAHVGLAQPESALLGGGGRTLLSTQLSRQRSMPVSLSKQAALWSGCWHENARPARDFVARVSTMSLPCASADAETSCSLWTRRGASGVTSTSTRVRNYQYEYARRFISKVLDELDVGENAFQVAIDIFSDSVERSLDCR